MIKCLIVDDEEPARELIRLHLANLEGFTIVSSFDNALDAFNYLQSHPVDLLFLDITMPRLSGLELLRSLKSVPTTILTTAYREYAADAFELEVFDYLVKPITRERFMKSVSKFLRQWNGEAEQGNEAFIYVKAGREQVKIYLNKILYVEGMADYIKLHTEDKSYILSERLSTMEERLPSTLFVRVHKSFIISLDKVTSYNAEQVVLKNKAFPLGRLFKAGFLRSLQNKPNV